MASNDDDLAQVAMHPGPGNGTARAVQPRPRVVVFAMEAAPNRGSEAAAGWGLTRAAMGFSECVLLTSTIFGANVEQWKRDHPADPLEVLVVPEPSIARFLRWHRIPRFLVYLAWLRRAQRVALRLHARRPFDASFSVTYSAYWLPCRAVDLGMPSVWGPVGGAVTTPLPLWRGLGLPGVFGELLDFLAVRSASLLPATRATWRKATVRLFNNEASLSMMPRDLPGTSLVLNNAPFVDVVPAKPGPRGRFVIFPSPLDPRKGPRLALQALAHTESDIRLVFAADGIERRPLERMAARLGLTDRVDFLGWIPRAQMFELLVTASASIHTGLREEGGVALTEAMIHGTPVIVLGHGGARTIAESTTDPARVALVNPASFDRTAREIAAAIDRFCAKPTTRTDPSIDREDYVQRLRGAFEIALGRALVAVPTTPSAAGEDGSLPSRNGQHADRSEGTVETPISDGVAS